MCTGGGRKRSDEETGFRDKEGKKLTGRELDEMDQRNRERQIRESMPKDEEEPDIQAREAREREYKKARFSGGAGSTILTSPFGAREQATVRRKTLLGQ